MIYKRSPIYFVTACVAKRQKLLANEEIHGAFKVFADCAPNRGAWVGAYVFMPDHVHLFVAIDAEELSLSRWMKSLKGTLSSKLGAQGNTPPYWQKGFFDHVLRSGDSYSQKWNYVRENPVRAGLAKDWAKWPYLGEISISRPSLLSISATVGERRYIRSAVTPLRLISLAFAFRVKRVVDDELALENLMICQAKLTETGRDPAQTFSSGMWLARIRIGGSYNFAKQKKRGISQLVFFKNGIEGDIFAMVAELTVRHIEQDARVDLGPVRVVRKKNKLRLWVDKFAD